MTVDAGTTVASSAVGGAVSITAGHGSGQGPEPLIPELATGGEISLRAGIGNSDTGGSVYVSTGFSKVAVNPLSLPIVFFSLRVCNTG